MCVCVCVAMGMCLQLDYFTQLQLLNTSKYKKKAIQQQKIWFVK